MKKSELINRWQTENGQAVLKSFVKSINNNRPLDNIIGLEKHADKWDLRGANFSALLNEQSVTYKQFEYNQNESYFKFKNGTLKAIDFSYANLKFSSFQNCKIEDCVFDNTSLKQTKIIGSHITNCLFHKSNLSYAWLNDNIADNSGSYKHVKFIESNLSESFFCFPEIENCVFENCNLRATNFDGSRFKDCTFLGVVDSCWFRGYSLNAAKSILGIFNRINLQKYRNKMQNIDFSNAKLIGVSFGTNINIDQCVFPQEGYLILKNITKVIPMARKTIDENWIEEDKKTAFHLIDNVYYKKEYFEQDFVLIDRYLLEELFGVVFANKLFELFKSFSSE